MKSSDRIRVLYLIDYWGSPGGTERHLSYLLQSLNRNRFECRVVVFAYFDNALAEAARKSGIEIVHIPVGRYYTPMALLRAYQLRRYVRRNKIDVVQTYHYKSDVYGALVAWLSGVPHIISSKRDAADYKGAFRFFMHKLVRPITEHYIAVSEVVATVVHQQEGVPTERISVIHNGVDLDRYGVPDSLAKVEAKVALGFHSGNFVIGMSARFRPEKDHALLLTSFENLLKRVPDARLILVGDGPLFARYKAYIEGSRLATSVAIVGEVHDVRPYLLAMDVACLVPSLNEGFSNSVLEKMATGLPLVVTDVGGNAEAVEHEVTGFVIQPGDHVSLEARLKLLHDDTSLRQSMGIAARSRAERLFSLESMVERHASLYQTIVSRDRR